MRRFFQWLFMTWPGRGLLALALTLTQYRVFASRTVRMMRFDLFRLRARAATGGRVLIPAHSKLHLGCGSKNPAGWVNADVVDAPVLVDLLAPLPWPDASFQAVVSEHVVEHLELRSELLSLLREIRRVCREGAEVWLSCPSLAAACRAYDEDRAAALLAQRKAKSDRWSSISWIDEMPTQQWINEMFHQAGDHRNLFDFDLLAWALGKAGFGQVVEHPESAIGERFEDFPARRDQLGCITVCAIAV